MKETAMSATRQLCTFRVDSLFLGVAVTDVQEVLRYQQMTSVPLAPLAIQGLINLRGRIVPAIDLRRCLRLGERPEGSRPMNVVLRRDEGACSLLVDEICDVVVAQAHSFEAPPENLTAEARGLISGVYKLEHELLLILDVPAVLSLDSVAA
jgi:purine-binding chemotaxis protein CheW